MHATTHSLIARQLPTDLEPLLRQPELTWDQVKLLASTGLFRIIDRHLGGRGTVYQLEPVDPVREGPIWRQRIPDHWRM